MPVHLDFPVHFAAFEASNGLTDLVDLDFNVLLTMSGSPLAVFATTEFLYVDFIAFGVADDFGSNLGAGNRRLAETKSLVIRNGQDSIKCHRTTGFGFPKVDFKFLASFNFVLTATVGNDRVRHF